MALAAAARRRLASCFRPALSHLLTAYSSGDATTTPCPLHPPQPLFRSPQFPLPQSSGIASQTLTLFPFGAQLAGFGPSRRGFSSLPPYRVAEAGAVLADAAAAPASPASIPSEVAWIAQDSSLSVEAVQHLIDAVHSFTGLNWWLSIAVSTVLLRSVLFTLMLTLRKQIPVGRLRQELLALKELIRANDEKSQREATERSLSVLKILGPMAFIAILQPYTFMALYFAISNMVQKLPSMKEGGALWFTDLTTPDALYIFPAMASLSLLLRLEFFLHYSKTERSLGSNIVGILFALTFPFAASFPKAICCYFISWSFVSLAQMIVLNQPAVKKVLSSKPYNPTCPSSERTTGPTAEDSSSPVDKREKPLPPERREASDSNNDQVRGQSDKESEKDS